MCACANKNYILYSFSSDKKMNQMCNFNCPILDTFKIISQPDKYTVAKAINMLKKNWRKLANNRNYFLYLPDIGHIPDNIRPSDHAIIRKQTEDELKSNYMHSILLDGNPFEKYRSQMPGASLELKTKVESDRIKNTKKQVDLCETRIWLMHILEDQLFMDRTEVDRILLNVSSRLSCYSIGQAWNHVKNIANQMTKNLHIALKYANTYGFSDQNCGSNQIIVNEDDEVDENDDEDEELSDQDQ